MSYLRQRLGLTRMPSPVPSESRDAALSSPYPDDQPVANDPYKVLEDVIYKEFWENEEFKQLLRKRGDEETRDKMYEALRGIVISNLSLLPRGTDIDKLVQQMLNELWGYGPLEPLLRAEDISEVQVNGPGIGRVRYEKAGKRIWAEDIGFRDKDHLLRVIEQIVMPTGRPFDELHPFVDTWLPDGSRVNAVHSKVAVDGPYLSIRRFIYAFTLEELVQRKALPPIAAKLLSACVEAGLNILISGGTGAGKTTFLNALSGKIPKDLSIVSCEDALELKLQHPDVRRHITVPATVEGKGEVTMKDIVKNALRQYPDWIIVGEMRGDEAFDAITAANTGHSLMTTVHANSAEEAISRLENLLLSAKPMPLLAIRQKIVHGFHLIVFVRRDRRTGVRYIHEIIQIAGMSGDEVKTIPLFRYDHRRGELVYTGQPFLFADWLEAYGLGLPPEIRTNAKTAVAVGS